MPEKMVNHISTIILKMQDKNGCWYVLKDGDKYFPTLNYYAPKYNSTLWTLVLLADIQVTPTTKKIIKPLKTISRHFFDDDFGIFSIGKSHFPIPCLNGNMMYLYNYFGLKNNTVIDGVVDFFHRYQRFDDGDFKTPSASPYFSNKSCFGKHSCYWGVVKLLKGLSFIPEERRTQKAKALLQKCIDFVLLHDVCFSSKNSSNYIHKSIQYLTFPNMYHSDFLEILWVLKREKVHSKKIDRALELLLSKAKPDGTWEIERPIRDLIVPINKRKYGNELVTKRAQAVLKFYCPAFNDSPNRIAQFRLK